MSNAFHSVYSFITVRLLICDFFIPVEFYCEFSYQCQDKDDLEHFLCKYGNQALKYILKVYLCIFCQYFCVYLSVEH